MQTFTGENIFWVLLTDPLIIGFFILFIIYTILVKTEVFVILSKTEVFVHLCIMAFWPYTLVAAVIYGLYKLGCLLLDKLK